MKKVSPQGKLRKKCDKLMQQIYTKKYPKCDICGAPTHCMHHFVEKSRSSRLRYEEENLIPLCFKCHYSVHNYCALRMLNNVNRSHEFTDKIINKRGGKKWKDKMEKLGRESIKVNMAYYKAKLEELTKLL